MWKDRTNSDSDTEPDKKQGNGFAGGIAGGIAFGNRHATMDESYHHARVQPVHNRSSGVIFICTMVCLYVGIDRKLYLVDDFQLSFCNY